MKVAMMLKVTFVLVSTIGFQFAKAMDPDVAGMNPYQAKTEAMKARKALKEFKAAFAGTSTAVLFDNIDKKGDLNPFVDDAKTKVKDKVGKWVDVLLNPDGPFLSKNVVNIGGGHQPADSTRDGFKKAYNAEIDAINHAAILAIIPTAVLPADYQLSGILNAANGVREGIQHISDTWIDTLLNPDGSFLQKKNVNTAAAVGVKAGIAALNEAEAIAEDIAALALEQRREIEKNAHGGAAALIAGLSHILGHAAHAPVIAKAINEGLPAKRTRDSFKEGLNRVINNY